MKLGLLEKIYFPLLVAASLVGAAEVVPIFILPVFGLGLILYAVLVGVRLTSETARNGTEAEKSAQKKEWAEAAGAVALGVLFLILMFCVFDVIERVLA